AEGPIEPGEVVALGPAGPLRLSPLVQWLEGDALPPAAGSAEAQPSRHAADDSPELFLLEMGGRREARLQAFPSGREIGSTAAQEWLARRAAALDEPEERAPRFDVPMIDRRTECEEFRRLLRRVMDDRQGQVLVIEGEAGIGKTKFGRFCREASAPLPVRVMSGAYRDHAGGAYAGFREALEDLFGIEMLERDAVAARLAERLPDLGYADSASEAADLAGFLTQLLRPLPGASELGGEGLDYVVGRIERFLR